MHDTIAGTPRVAIYARFSSHLQKPTSIQDQIRLCREKAHALGGHVLHVHHDAALTGTTMQFRPGLDDLLLQAKNRRIDLVFTEALDRLSRDNEHMQGIYKRLRYWEVGLYTLDLGEIQPIHVFVGGFMSQAWTENLAAKTRRGQIGAVHAGRIPGGLSYGYRSANRIDDAGRPIRGLRTIDPHQADVIRRIYHLYADGSSARDIAATLNREGVPGPRGREWGSTTINGNRQRRNGILNNELYRGQLVYGRQKFVRDPDTGMRQARPVPRSDWEIKDLPHLRIVDDALWQRVQNRRLAGQDRRQSSAAHTPLPLTGLLRCGTCGGTMTIMNRGRYACHAHRDKGICDNPRGVDAEKLENQICSLLAQHILAMGNLAKLVKAAASESLRRRNGLDARIADIQRKIARWAHGIESGAHSLKGHHRIAELEQNLAGLQIELETLPEIPDRTPANRTGLLVQRLSILKGAINQNPAEDDTRRRALHFVALLIETIHILPLPERGKIDIAVRPRNDALVALALHDNWPFETADAGEVS